jgi:hypothetical protein
MFNLRKGNKGNLIFVRMVNELHVQNLFMLATCFTLPTFATLVMKYVIFRVFFPQFCDIGGLFTKRLNQIWLEVREKSNFFSNATLYWKHTNAYGLNMANSTLISLKYGNFEPTFPQKPFG